MSITKEASKMFKVIKWIYDNPVTINRNSNKMDKFHGKKKAYQNYFSLTVVLINDLMTHFRAANPNLMPQGKNLELL